MSARTSPFETTVASFGPKPKARRTPTAQEIDSTAQFPSREPIVGGEGKVTLGINCNPDVKQRFKALCKEERYNYAEMLTILMDKHQQG